MAFTQAYCSNCAQIMLAGPPGDDGQEIAKDASIGTVLAVLMQAEAAQHEASQARSPAPSQVSWVCSWQQCVAG